MKKLATAILSLALLAGFALAPTVARAQFSDQSTYVATPGGTANAITLPVPNWSRNLPGVVIRFVPSAANTGATTVNVNGVGAIELRKQTGNGLSALVGGELVPAQLASITYDGTQFQLLSPPPSAAFTTPGGYMTPCDQTATPISGCSVGSLLPTGDVVATTLYYTPVTNRQIPINNGVATISVPFSQLSLTLTGGSNGANTMYDVCVTTVAAGSYSPTGTPFLVTGPPWTSSSAGGGYRGAGPGTSEITRVDGILVNAQSFNGKNSSTTISNIPAYRCTLVGSIMIDGVAGQVTYTRLIGQSRKWGGANVYNQIEISMQVTDPQSSWEYSSSTVRPSKGNANNSMMIVQSVPLNQPLIEFSQTITGSINTHSAQIGVGWNQTSSFTSLTGLNEVSNGIAYPYYMGQRGFITPSPFIGAGIATAIESSPFGNAYFRGTATFMLLMGRFRA